ncbi:hypothetical protein [Salinicola acroporae]|uniref:hypothetical protein n=1 Tax=Salinicola acroporae TaxID=1541440 RepID=UPI002456E03C|nr:hypothetical protein [Salinicola acroporae]
MPIQTIRAQRLYRQIADQLLVLIRQGEFPRAPCCRRSATWRSSWESVGRRCGRR